ncbi:MAG: DUF3078 domain-containing protein [Bacteroidota bacterium]
MKKLLLTLICMFAVGSWTMAQDAAENEASADSTWTLGGMGSLTYNEVGLFNWAAGGQSNMTLIGNLSLWGNRKWATGTWENQLDLAYGFIKNNFIFDPQSPIVKAEDKIEFNSKYGRKAWSDKVFYSGLLTFRTQFAPGFAAPGDQVYISRGLAPAYLILAAGLDYKPNDKLSIFFSPVSGKITIVTDDSLSAVGAFGVNNRDENGDLRPGAGENVRFEFGATFRAKYKADIMKNVGLESNLELFSNYIDRPQNIDVRWTNALIAKVNKFITVNLFTDLIYDHDIDIPLVDKNGAPDLSINPEPMPAPFDDGTYWPADGFNYTTNPSAVQQVQRKGPRIQFKQIFGIGLGYKF